MLGAAAMLAEVLRGAQNSDKVLKTLPMQHINSLRFFFFKDNVQIFRSIFRFSGGNEVVAHCLVMFTISHLLLFYGFVLIPTVDSSRWQIPGTSVNHKVCFFLVCVSIAVLSN